MIEVLRIRRWLTYRDAPIRNLVLRAIFLVEYPGTTPEDLYAEWGGRISEDAFGLFVGYQDDVPLAVVVASLPTSHTMMAPQVFLGYNEGRPELARRVAKSLRVWLMSHGASRLLAINLRHTDPAFMRGLSYLGRSRRLASLIEFEL